MAVGDVFSLHVDIELPDSMCSVNFHYQEVTSSDSPSPQCEALAIAYMQQLGPDWQGLLSNLVNVTGVRVYKRSQPVAAPAYFTDRRPGGNAGSPLPANNGLRVGIVQGVHGARSNGLVWIPGVRELDCNGNTFTNAFMTGAAATFSAAIGQLVIETPQTGQWRLGVLSRKFLVANPGDYAGAFADAIAATVSPIVGSQRPRTTKRRGAPGAVI